MTQSIRHGTQSGGFPKSPEDLFGYQSIILDDVEAEFFSQDQMQLDQGFPCVAKAACGSLLMLGGVDTFKSGHYDKTVIGDMLPVYMSQIVRTVQEHGALLHGKLTQAKGGWSRLSAVAIGRVVGEPAAQCDDALLRS